MNIIDRSNYFVIYTEYYISSNSNININNFYTKNNSNHKEESLSNEDHDIEVFKKYFLTKIWRKGSLYLIKIKKLPIEIEIY